MKLLGPTTEADMVSAYLKAEIISSRFGQFILDLLEQGGFDRALVDHPDLGSPADNLARRQILAGYRAYVFEELPANIAWQRALLSRDELMRVRYIDYDYWNELSNGTRLASAAAETITAGREVFGVSNEGFHLLARAIRAGARFPELIVVGASPEAALTVYEGHARLTGYLLAPECIPDELEVIAGFAPECARI